MPLTDDDIQQSNSGSFTGTSGTATLPAGTVAGNTVLLFVFTVGNAVVSVPTGFVQDSTTPVVNGSGLYLFRRTVTLAAAGETSWSLAVASSQLTVWKVREYSNIDLNSPRLSTAAATSTSVLANADLPISSIYVTGSAAEDAVVFGLVGGFDAGSTPPAYSVSATDVTSGSALTATIDAAATGTNGTNAATLQIAEEYTGPRVGLSYTGTITLQRSTTGHFHDLGVAYRAKGTALYPTLTHILGGQHGTAAGWTTGTAGFTYLASASAGVSITTTNPRHDTYAFRCSATTTACNLTDRAVTVASGVFVGRLSFRLNGTPAANLELGGTVSGVTFRYVQATGLLGCKVGTGTEVFSAATVSASAWYSIDYRLDTSGTAWACEWSTTPDATKVAAAETTATATGVATTSFQPRAGWTTASTGDVNFSDMVGSSTSAAYPLGDYQVRGIKIDGTLSAAATPGTPANWGLFTANGTVGAWNDTTAAATLDELPATIGATADGVVNVTATSSDQVGFRFEPITVTPAGTAKGARCCAIGWAASGTASAIGARVSLGAAFDSSYAPVADYNFDNSTTAPAWLCSGIVGTGAASARMTQSLLNIGATFLFGAIGAVTTDATPDVGFHAAYLELAVKIAPPLTLQRGPDGNATATLYQDFNTSGYVGLTFQAPADRGMGYTYEYPAGTPVTSTLAAGASVTVALDADVLTSVPKVTCTLDPAP